MTRTITKNVPKTAPPPPPSRLVLDSRPQTVMDPLYKALEARMEAEDTKSRPARVQALLGRLETLLGTGGKAEAGSVAPASSELLCMDPGEVAIGKFGFFFDTDPDNMDTGSVDVCVGYQEGSKVPYSRDGGVYYKHFLPLQVHPAHETMLRKAVR